MEEHREEMRRDAARAVNARATKAADAAEGVDGVINSSSSQSVRRGHKLQMKLADAVMQHLKGKQRLAAVEEHLPFDQVRAREGAHRVGTSSDTAPSGGREGCTASWQCAADVFLASSRCLQFVFATRRPTGQSELLERAFFRC